MISKMKTMLLSSFQPLRPTTSSTILLRSGDEMSSPASTSVGTVHETLAFVSGRLLRS